MQSIKTEPSIQDINPTQNEEEKQHGDAIFGLDGDKTVSNKQLFYYPINDTEAKIINEHEAFAQAGTLLDVANQFFNWDNISNKSKKESKEESAFDKLEKCTIGKVFYNLDTNLDCLVTDIFEKNETILISFLYLDAIMTLKADTFLKRFTRKKPKKDSKLKNIYTTDKNKITFDNNKEITWSNLIDTYQDWATEFTDGEKKAFLFRDNNAVLFTHNSLPTFRLDNYYGNIVFSCPLNLISRHTISFFNEELEVLGNVSNAYCRVIINTEDLLTRSKLLVTDCFFATAKSMLHNKHLWSKAGTKKDLVDLSTWDL